MSPDSFSSSLKFDQSELAIDAARRDQGLVLTSRRLVEEDVQLGFLVRNRPAKAPTELQH